LYRAGSLVAVSRKPSKYKLDLVGLQEVEWQAVVPNQKEETHFQQEEE
jgi:hypothetical protein